MDTKICSKCNINKTLLEFSNDKSKADGKYPSCKECKKQNNKHYRDENIEKIKETNKIYYTNNSDKIKTRVYNWCKDNEERKKEYSKKYFQDNYDKIKLKQSEWNLNNADKMTGWMNNYMKNRYLNDLHFRMKTIISARLRSLTNTKNKSSLQYLGCSLEFFTKWIEYQFDQYMDWDNHGEYWHYDHVTPCKSFDLSKESEIDKCFNWKNIRPLNKIENIKKSSIIDESIISSHNNVVIKFLTLYDVPS